MLYFEGLWIKIHRNAVKSDFLAPFMLVLVGTSSPADEPYFVLGDFLFGMSVGISSKGFDFYEDQEISLFCDDVDLRSLVAVVSCFDGISVL